MRSNLKILIAVLCAFIFAALGYWMYDVSRRMNMLSNSHVDKTKIDEAAILPKRKDEAPEALQSDISDRKRYFWSKLQSQFKDTVAQVFSQVTEFNWLEPYKSPSQGEGSGTAFFINDKGALITNAHVVDQALPGGISIQIPSTGKRRYKVHIVGVSPERDLALLQLDEKEVVAMKKELRKETLPYLAFGDSDSIMRADKIMVLGYPLGQQALKSTMGVVSGREHMSGQYYIQIDAPLNKGNSGGPSLDRDGNVIGVNSAIIQNAQSVGYIIPINEVKLFLSQLETVEGAEPKLLKKPFLGVLFNNASENLVSYLGNPQPGGLYVVEIYKGSPLHSAGIQAGDMIYKINDMPVDIYGEMNVPWSKEDRVSIIDYVSRLKIGQKIALEYYRNGKKRQSSFIFTQSERPPIRRMYPGYEKIDYEVFGGLVLMQLSLNHILLLAQYAPELVQYADVKKHVDPALIITHVMLNSPASKSRSIGAGSVIKEVNGEPVKTIDDLRKVFASSAKSGYVTIKTTENVFLVIPTQELLENEPRLARTYFYQPTQMVKDLQALLPEIKQ